MMKNILKYCVYLLLVISISSFAVKKSNDDSVITSIMNPDLEETSAAYKAILSGMHSKKWTASSFTIAGFTQQCRLDDQFEFHADGNYTYYGGKDLCGDSPSDVSKRGTWTINALSNSLTFDAGTDYEYTANIIVANNGSLELKGTYYLLPIRGKYIN